MTDEDKVLIASLREPWTATTDCATRKINRLLQACRRAANRIEVLARTPPPSALENGPAGLADAHSKSPDIASQSERIAVLEAALKTKDEALKPFAAIADIFDQHSANRPREGEIMSWVDHRVGERLLTVEMLHSARSALAPLGEE